MTIQSRLVRPSAAILVFLLSAPGILAQGTYKAESIGAPGTSDLPKTLADTLDPAGARLSDGQGKTVCEVWLRSSLSTGAASGSAVYPLSVGNFVGVIRFPAGGSDFRGQTVKAGSYTMRYGQIPQDGNHLGASSFPDFLVLTPADADTQIDQALKFDAMVAQSRKASGTAHPLVLSLIPASDAKASPAAAQDEQGHWALQLKAKAGLTIAVIVVGKSEAA